MLSDRYNHFFFYNVFNLYIFNIVYDDDFVHVFVGFPKSVALICLFLNKWNVYVTFLLLFFLFYRAPTTSKLFQHKN